MDSDIFKQVKQLVSIKDLATYILGKAEYKSGSEAYWFSQTHQEKTASLGANEEKQIISDFSDESFGKGLDIFSFIVSLNNHPTSNKKHFIAEKEINNWDALVWLVNEFKLDIDISSKLPVLTSNSSPKITTTTSIEYSLELTEPKYVIDNYIYALFDNEYFLEKPNGSTIGKIKNRIKAEDAGAYPLQLVKDKMVNGFTCIPGAIKSETDWVDDENFYQIFMVDISKKE